MEVLKPMNAIALASVSFSQSLLAGRGGGPIALLFVRPQARRPTLPSRMKVIAAYLLAVLGGNTNPSSDDLKDILGSVGAEADDERIEFFLSEMKGKDITELIATGREKFASVPSGGGAIAVAAPTAASGGAAAAAAPEPKKEEKVEEKEESDEDLGFGLFD